MLYYSKMPFLSQHLDGFSSFCIVSYIEINTYIYKQMFELIIFEKGIFYYRLAKFSNCK